MPGVPYPVSQMIQMLRSGRYDLVKKMIEENKEYFAKNGVCDEACHEIYAEPPVEDMVESPKHYQITDEIEAKDVIRAILGEVGWKAYCKGSMLKYLLRQKWDNDEDVAKAARFGQMYGESDE